MRCLHDLGQSRGGQHQNVFPPRPDSGDMMIKERTDGQAKDDLILTFDQVQLLGQNDVLP